MRRDFHMHPTVVGKVNRFDDFACRAIELGIEEVCITDHMPLSFSSASDRIPVGKVQEYCQKVRQIAEDYEGRLKVYCGIEIDYHPSVLGEAEQVLKEGDFDFILGSTHMHIFLKDKMLNGIEYNEFAEAALRNTLAAVNSGYFTTITHFDMFRRMFVRGDRYRFLGEEYRAEKHWELITEILLGMKERNMFLEINPHFAEISGNFENMYPEKSIVRLALDMGLEFRYGSDAHQAKSVGAMLDQLEKHSVYGRAFQI